MLKRMLYITVGLMALLLVPGWAGAQAEKPVEVAGDWEMTVETPFGNFTSMMKLQREGDALVGRSIGRTGRETTLKNVRLNGKTISFDQDITAGGMDLHMKFNGSVEGDNIKGTFETNGQTMNWSAKRVVTVPVGKVTGAWLLTVDSPNGPQERTLNLKEEGGKLTGTISGQMGGNVAVEEIVFQGQELRFVVPMMRNGQTRRRTYVAKLDNDTLKGSIEGRNNATSFTGRRPAPSAVAGIAGTWKLSVEAPDQTHHPSIVLVQEGAQWTGKFVLGAGSESPLKQVAVNGTQLSFVADIEVNGEPIRLVFTGTVDGPKLKGTMKANGQDLPTTGERTPSA